VALNFASAKNPGGGFLGGAKALEEDMARASALYHCLLRQSEYYTINRAGNSMLCTDHIYSPLVPFFRIRGPAQPVRVPALLCAVTCAAQLCYTARVLLPHAQSLPLEDVMAHFHAHGWARVGRVVQEDTLAALRARTKEMMLGTVHYDGLFFQHDSGSGKYEDLQIKQGFVGPSLHYRKIEKLELDPLFRAFMNNALFERIARTEIPGDVVLYRAVLFAKAAHGGTHLPWHQDGGIFWGLSGQPTLQIWTALDDASAESGCLEVVPGSHRGGLVTRLGGVVHDTAARAANAEDHVIKIPARAGEVLLIHNHLWHRSGVNVTDVPRRALTLCLMDSSIRCVRKKRAPRVFFPLFQRA